MSPQNVYIEAQIPGAIALRDGAYERWLGLHEAMRMGPLSWD